MKEGDCEDKFLKKIEARYSISYFKKNFFYWFGTPFEQTFTSLSSVSNFSAKGKGAAENISSAVEAWSLLFSDDLLNLILKYTNQEIEQKRKSCNKNRKSRFRALDMLELKAFIGLLYYASLTKKKNAFLPKYFAIHGLPLFRAAMSKTRFEFLLSYLPIYDPIYDLMM